MTHFNAPTTLLSVIEYYRIPVDYHTDMISCPFHADGTPSCHLNFHENIWHCFGCKKDGGVLDFIEQKENCSRGRAFHIAKEIASGISGFYTPKYVPMRNILYKQNAQKVSKKTLQKVSKKTSSKNKSVNGKKEKTPNAEHSLRDTSRSVPVFPSFSRYQEVLEKILELCPVPEEIQEKCLLKKNSFSFTTTLYSSNPEEKTIYEKEYYTSPVFQKSTLLAFRVGYIGTMYKELLASLREAGFTDDEICSCNVFKRNSKGTVILSNCFKNRILYPYLREGKPMHIIARKAGKSCSAGKYRHVFSHPNSGYRVLNEDILTQTAQVLIAEGVTDCMKANENGFPSISPVTTHFSHATYAFLCASLKGKRVVICFDTDPNDSGQKGAKDVQETLLKGGISAEILTLPVGRGGKKQDLCEFLNTFGKGELLKLFEEQGILWNA
ncbi:MAG: CHC2 zinc finger domain-containing protein [Candidatus Peregrinibacteria bacterium]